MPTKDKPPTTPRATPRARKSERNAPPADLASARRRRASALRAKADDTRAPTRPTKADDRAGKRARQADSATQRRAMHDAMPPVLPMPPMRRTGQHPTPDEREQAKQVFLDAFAEHANLTFAARAAGVARQTIYEWRQQDDAFKAAYEAAEAEASDVIRKTIHDRAVVGWYEPVVSMGEVVKNADGDPWLLHKYDSTLLQKLAAARLPEWRPQQDVTVNGGMRTEVVYVNDWRRAMQSGVIVPATVDPSPHPPALPEPPTPSEPSEPVAPAPTLGIEIVYASADDE